MRRLLITVVAGLFFSTAHALPAPGRDAAVAWNEHEPLALHGAEQGRIPDAAGFVAEAGKESAPQSPNPAPESGSLIIPGEEEDGQKEKKCLTICKRWGEDCIINPQTGNRDCRRTCKEFGEECF